MVHLTTVAPALRFIFLVIACIQGFPLPVEAAGSVHRGQGLLGSGGTWFVAQDGRDAVGCGRAAGRGACASLAGLSAFGDVADGDGVLLQPGPNPYTCTAASFSKNLTLSSTSPTEMVVFDCAWQHSGIFFDAAHVSVHGLAFRRCSGAIGGCLRFANAFHVQVASCSFQGCRALQRGGCVDITTAANPIGARISVVNTSFSDARVLATASGTNGTGGAISVVVTGRSRSTHVTVEGYSSFGNTCAQFLGGAVVVFFEGEASGANVSIAGNLSAHHVSAGVAGGALCVFFQGAATAVHVVVPADLDIRAASAAGGGAVSVFYGDAAASAGVAFTGSLRCASSTAYEWGGAILVFYTGESEQTSVQLLGTLIVQNVSAGFGGGGVAVLSTASSSAAAVQLEGSHLFANATAQGWSGGGVLVAFFDDAMNVNVTVGGNGNFTDTNAPALHGGGIAIAFSGAASHCRLRFDGVQNFSRAAAGGGGGGGIAATFAERAEECSVTFAGNHTFTETRALVDGGAISIAFENETSAAAVVVGGACSFMYSSTEGSGGAVGVAYKGDAFRAEVSVLGMQEFKNVSAAGAGGAVAIRFWQASVGTFVAVNGSSRFVNSWAGERGGALSVRYGAFTALARCAVAGDHKFTNARAGWEGGAVSAHFSGTAENASVQILGENTFVQTVAGEAGGAVCVRFEGPSQGTSVSVSGENAVTNATAEGYGGSIAVLYTASATDASLTMSGVNRFATSRAQQGGSVALFFGDSADNIAASVGGQNAFVNSSAGMTGGGVAVIFNSTVFLANVVVSGANVFAGCKSSGTGGAIAVTTAMSASQLRVGYEGTNECSHGSASILGGCVAVLLSGEVSRSAIWLQGANTFTDTSALAGGAAVGIAVLATVQHFNVSVLGTNRFANLVARNGGGVYVRATPSRIEQTAIVVAGGAIFSNITAASSGGSLYLSLFGAQHAANNSITVEDVSIYASTAMSASGFGGGLYALCSADTPLVFDAPEVQQARLWTRTCATAIRNVSVTSSRAAFGGCVALESGDIAIQNSGLTACTALEGGGAIFAGGSGSVDLAHSRLVNGTSGSAGGSAVYFGSSSTFAARNATILAAPQSQSALYVPAATSASYDGGSLVCPRGYVLHENAVSSVALALPWAAGVDSQCCATTHVTVDCSACPAGKYSLQQAFLGEESEPCMEEPYGAVSSGADQLAARPGYWGEVRADAGGATGSGAVQMAQCPRGYCCPGPGVCTPTSFCPGNRQGIMCGECQAGFSQLYSSEACTKTSRCGRSYYFVLAVVVAGALSLWYVHGKHGRSSGLTTSVVYFYQVLPLLLVSADERDLWMRGFSAVFNFRIPAFSAGRSSGADAAGLCPVPGLTAVGKQFLHMSVPLLVFACLGAILVVESVWLPKWRAKGRFAAGALSVLLLTYSAVSEGTFALVHCVPYDGRMRLWISGETVCYQPWQVIMMLVVIALFAFPVALFRWHMRVRRRTGGASATVNMLESAFVTSRWYWETVILFRRLVLAGLYSFVRGVFTRTVLLTLACVGFLLVHVYTMPLRAYKTNAVETVSLFLLVVIGALNLRSAAYVDAGEVLSGPLEDTTQAIYVAESLLLFIPVALYVGFVAAAYLRRRRSGGSVRVELCEPLQKDDSLDYRLQAR